MKKTLRITWKILVLAFKILMYPIYVLFTLKEIDEYYKAKSAGRQVLGSENGLNSTTYHMGRYLEEGELPERKFVTFKEWFGIK